MRYILFLVFAALIFGGCKFTDNVAGSGTGSSLSTDAVLDSVLYTFSIPQTTFGKNDTLKATLTAYNQSSTTDTLLIGYSSNFYTWSLINNNTGDTLMYGPTGSDNSAALLFLASGQSEVLYSINQHIADKSGAAVKQGKYTLRWNLNNGTTNLLWFSINLTLQ